MEYVDTTQNTENDPRIIKEHVFVVSDNDIQDHDSMYQVQKINNYFEN